MKYPLWTENETNIYAKCLGLATKLKEVEAERDSFHAQLINRSKEDRYSKTSYDRLQKKLRNFPVIPMMRAGWEEKRLEVWYKFARNVYRWRDDYRGKWHD